MYFGISEQHLDASERVAHLALEPPAGSISTKHGFVENSGKKVCKNKLSRRDDRNTNGVGNGVGKCIFPENIITVGCSLDN